MFEEVWIGHSILYWVKEDEKLYKTKGDAIEHRVWDLPGHENFKQVIEHNGKHYVLYNRRWVVID